jgi:hypothetical protein
MPINQLLGGQAQVSKSLVNLKIEVNFSKFFYELSALPNPITPRQSRQIHKLTAC